MCSVSVCRHIFSPILTKFTRKAKRRFASSPAGPQPAATAGHGRVWWPAAVHRPRDSPLLLTKMTHFPLHQLFTRVALTFPIIYSSDPYIQAGTMSSWTNWPPCSVWLGPCCRPRGDRGRGRGGGQARSSLNSAVYVWELSEAGLVRHGVRRENRVVA